MFKENIKNLKKLAAVTGSVFVLSGCGASNVCETVKVNTSNNNNVSFSDIDNSNSSLQTTVTTGALKKQSVSTKTTSESKVDNSILEAVYAPVATKAVVSETTVATEKPQVVASQTTVATEAVVSETTFSYDSSSIVKGEDTTTSVNNEDLCFIDDGWDRFSCEFFKSNFSYFYTNDSYMLKENDTIETVCDNCNMNASQIYQFNPDFDSYVPGDFVVYPIIVEVYNAKKNETLLSVVAQTGLDADYIKKINGIPEENETILSDTGLILNIVKGNDVIMGNTSYETSVGVSNEVYGNKIFGDKLLFGTGYSHASQDLLVLNCFRRFDGYNTAIYYQFDGSNNYKSKVIAKNVSDIGMVNGIPVAYERTQEEIDYLTNLYDIAADESYKLATTYGQSVFMGTDENGRKFATYDERVICDDKSAISGISMVKKR